VSGPGLAAAGASVLAGHGVTLSLPAGWEGRIFRRVPKAPETTHPVVHLGNFALPPAAGDYGDRAVQLMGPQHAFVALVEFPVESTRAALFSSNALPWPLPADGVSRSSLQRSVPGQAGIQRFFSTSGRAWCVYVVVGSWSNRGALLAEANAALSGVRIAAA
jgi:hypothetical protein